MRAWPDAARLLAFLARAGRRRMMVAAIEGAAVGGFAALALLVLTRDGQALAAATAGVVLAGAAIGAWRARHDARAAARSVEQRAPACRNVVITAAELLDARARVRADIGERICRDAARAVEPLRVSQLFPARRAVASSAAAVVAWALAAWLIAAPRAVPAATPAGDGSGPAGPAISALTVTVTPPAYVSAATDTMDDPAEVRALEGSRLDVSIDADADTIAMRRGDSVMTLTRRASGTFDATIDVDATTLVTFEPSNPSGITGTPRLLSVAADPDRAPRVRISEPGQDLFVPDASARVSIGVEADDDFGLASLALTYTRVSGSGENFEFVSGEVPLSIAPDTSRSWSGAGTLDLSTLALEPGDMVVYRAVAADRRPGSLPVESDAFIIEILAPGEAAADGFAIDDQRDRYALSQRMVLLKTERLAARAPATPAPLIAEEAQIIAAEQRQVRAEFIFMMGGELSEFGENSDPFMLHEEDEAHGEADIAAGRLVNEGRAELTRAVRAMSMAATALATAALDDALAAEREALEALQNAFSKSRYILRALSERESIDLDRRLSGTLSDLARGPLPAVAADRSADEPRRRALAALLSVMASEQPDAAAVIALAQAVLDIDPSSDTLRGISRELADAARALGASDAAEAGRHLDGAAAALAAEARATLPGAGRPAPDGRSRLLRGLNTGTGVGGGR